MRKQDIAVIGGDMRNYLVANILHKDGHKVKIFGFNEVSQSHDLYNCSELEEALTDADTIIGPIPITQDGKNLYMPLSGQKIMITELIGKIPSKSILISGKLNSQIIDDCGKKEVELWDILEREDFAVLNAIPSAEGAISIALQEMPITLHGCKAAVIGFGRIGKVLSKFLRGFGADVFVVARRVESLVWADCYDCNPVEHKDIASVLGEADVVFNTVPSMVLDKNYLELLQKQCLIVDLASKPGGVNFDIAKDLGLKVIWALSLPAKIAPHTAAKIVRDAVYNIWKERWKNYVT